MKNEAGMVMSPDRALTQAIKRLAQEHGLHIARVTTAESFPGLAEHLAKHIAAGHMEGLEWFTPERAEVSARPKALMPEAVSILSVGIPYWSIDPGMPDDEPRGRIARYAWGVDYHRLLKRRMAALQRSIEALIGRPLETRTLTDHARIVDRAVAARSGLGWYGKNACIIVPGHGSWVMLGEMLLDLPLEPDLPLAHDCGRCTLCLSACPTGALVAPYTVHTPLCLSFQTIEQRGPIPREIRAKQGDWVFGCDVCQDVCPYTKAAKPEPDPDFLPRRIEHAYPSLTWLLTASPEELRETYQGTAILRAKPVGLARNAAVALGNVGNEVNLPTLERVVAEHPEGLVRGHAAWAIGRLRERDVLGSRAWIRAEAALERALQHDTDAFVREEARSALAEVAA